MLAAFLLCCVDAAESRRAQERTVPAAGAVDPFLKAFKEERLDRSRPSKQNETWRLTIYPTFGPAECVRVDRKGEQVTLTIKRLDGQAGYYAGRLVINELRQMTADEWRTFHSLVRDEDIWRPDDDKLGVMTLDGTSVTLERSLPSGYRVVCRGWPRTGAISEVLKFLRDLCNWETRLADEKLMERLRENLEFIKAAKEGDLKTVRRLLDAGVCVDTDHGKALGEAVRGRHYDVVAHLLKRRASMENIRLGDVVQSCDIRMLKLLLEHGCSPHQSGYMDDTLTLALARGYLDIAQLLLRAGADLKSKGAIERSSVGECALCVAAEAGQVDSVRWLLKHGVPVDVRDYSNRTPLWLASLGGHKCSASEDKDDALRKPTPPDYLATMKLLLSRGADLHVYDEPGASLLHAAAMGGRPEILRFLLEKIRTVDDSRQTDGVRPLHLAAQEGHLEAVRILVQQGADVSEPTKTGYHPYHLAIESGHREVVEFLLARGARRDLNIELYIAVEKQEVARVKELLAAGANVNAFCGQYWEYRKTPLLAAVDKENVKLVSLLLAHGANSNIPDVQNRLPIHEAAQLNSREIIEQLLKAGAKLETRDGNGRTVFLEAVCAGKTESAAWLISRGADPLARDVEGRTALMLACTNYKDSINLDFLKMLIRKGVDVKARDKNGMTAFLHYATRGNENNCEPFRVLLDAGADINEKTPEGLNALWFAIGGGLNGWTERPKWLIKHGCDVHLPRPFTHTEDDQPVSLLRWARGTDQQDVVELLERAGVKE